MVELHVLPAEAGDCILIRYGSNNSSMNNIIVDGGVYNNSYDIKDLIEKIDKNKEKTDIIITHVDSDHILGVLGGLTLCDKNTLNNCIRNIYLNTICGIYKQTNENEGSNDDPLNKIKLSISSDGGYSISQAVSLLDLINLKGIENKLIDYTIAGQVVEVEGAVLRIISPTKMELNKLAEQWKMELPHVDYLGAGYSSHYPCEIYRDLSILMEEKLPQPDTSIYNKSSIAFVFEYEDIKILMLGDSSAKTCFDSLRELYSGNPLFVDAVKLSHHGSSRNISDDLLDYVITDTFILSTNGRLMNGMAKMPGKHTISRLIKKKHNDYINLLNNYEWWENCYYGRFFTRKDIEQYIDSEVLRLIYLNQGDFKVKEGFKVYGY